MKKSRRLEKKIRGAWGRGGAWGRAEAEQKEERSCRAWRIAALIEVEGEEKIRRRRRTTTTTTTTTTECVWFDNWKFDDWESWRSEDLRGTGTRLEDMRRLEKTSIVCYLMIENLGGVRILEEWWFWRSEDLGGAGTNLEDRRSLEKTSIVCYLMIGNLGGVMILKEWGFWRSMDEIGG
jgi:hypothetical protein